MLRSFSLSDRGRRPNNEDFAAFYEPADPAELEESGCLYIIADGVGGATKGERASQFAAQKVLYEYYRQPNSHEPGERLRAIMEKVNGDIHTHAEQNGTRMATTMVAVVIRRDVLHMANVGDSRAYLIRGGEARQLTRDHSIVGELLRTGELTEAEAMASKVKNRLTRSLGGDPQVHVDVYPPMPLIAGDRILLCSDGLTRYARREDVYKMVSEGSPEEIARQLVQFANEQGGADNISVIVVSYQAAEAIAPPIPIELPREAELDTLDTQPGFQKPSPGQRSSMGLMVTLSMLVVLMSVVIGFLIIPQLDGVRRRILGTSRPPTVVISPLASVTTMPVAEQVEMTPTITVTPSPTETPTPSPEPAQTVLSPSAEAISPKYLCIARIKEPEGDNYDTLSAILKRFGLTWTGNYPYQHCTVFDVGTQTCRDDDPIVSPRNIQPGWWIIIPVPDENACNAGEGGQWVQDGRP